jgi:hypothetical protein
VNIIHKILFAIVTTVFVFGHGVLSVIVGMWFNNRLVPLGVALFITASIYLAFRLGEHVRSVEAQHEVDQDQR